MLAKAAKESSSLGDISFHRVGLPVHVCTVSVFGKKSDAVCGFLAYFCAVLQFSDPPYAPLVKGYRSLILTQRVYLDCIETTKLQKCSSANMAY